MQKKKGEVYNGGSSELRDARWSMASVRLKRTTPPAAPPQARLFPLRGRDDLEAREATSILRVGMCVRSSETTGMGCPAREASLALGMCRPWMCMEERREEARTAQARSARRKFFLRCERLQAKQECEHTRARAKLGRAKEARHRSERAREGQPHDVHDNEG